jgi:hypothetical protein
MIIKKTKEKGVFTVHRTEDEKPFAELLSPSFRKLNRWGIVYRGLNQEFPFNRSSVNVSHPTRDSAEYEFKKMIRICSPWQLGLETK